MKVTFWINTGFAGANYQDTLELDDNSGEEDLEFEMKEYLNNHIDYGYYKEENDEDK